jgi:hypothetical protein
MTVSTRIFLEETEMGKKLEVNTDELAAELAGHLQDITGGVTEADEVDVSDGFVADLSTFLEERMVVRINFR